MGKKVWEEMNIFTHNPIALRKAKTVYNFGISECNRVKFHSLLTEKHPENCMNPELNRMENRAGPAEMARLDLHCL